jgi:hypothetical protein
LTTENDQTEVNKSEPFTHESFYSSLKQANINEEEYKTYLKEYASAASIKSSPEGKVNSDSMGNSPCGLSNHPCGAFNRFDYLLYYNERDTQIMTPIVDGLIDLFWENKIDMLHNLSLSSCVSQAKYALAYKDFDINQDYNPPAQRVYKLTEKSWLNKVENYRQQDEKAKRDTSKNVSKNDYHWACL